MEICCGKLLYNLHSVCPLPAILQSSHPDVTPGFSLEKPNTIEDFIIKERAALVSVGLVRDDIKHLKDMPRLLCPNQLANDGIFCGHYVGCFIEDVLRSGEETSIDINFTRANRLMCYSQDKMVRFRDNWAGFLYNRFLKGKLLNM